MVRKFQYDKSAVLVWFSRALERIVFLFRLTKQKFSFVTSSINFFMLTAQQLPDEFKIVWDLEDGIRRDPAEFAALTLLPQGEGAALRACSCYCIGSKKAPLLEWRALINALQPLLERHVKVRLICSDQKMATWLKEIGVFLLGEIVVDPQIVAERKSVPSSVTA